MLSVCSVAWIEIIRYCCSQMGQAVDRFPTSRFNTVGWESQCRSVLLEIYSHLCLTDSVVEMALRESGPRPFSLSCLPPWGGLCDVSTTGIGANLVNDILIETRVQLVRPIRRCALSADRPMRRDSSLEVDHLLARTGVSAPNHKPDVTTRCFSCGQFGHMQARCPKPDASLPYKPAGWFLQSEGNGQRDQRNRTENSP